MMWCLTYMLSIVRLPVLNRQAISAVLDLFLFVARYALGGSVLCELA